MLKEEVLKTIETYNLIEKNDKIVIGVSGGPDSICLLHVLYGLKEKLGIEIVVAHVNHMLRDVADLETEYVQSFCKKLGIECYVKKADILEISKTQKKGTEEVGRQVRYDFFDEVAKKTNSNKIATAHNSNDRAETVILNILRGSGLSGLKGIEPIRDNKYIRPLINTDRQDIEIYCNDNKLEPKYDKTNNENIYTRNKVRNTVIPYIKKEFNPNIIKTINRLSSLATEENEYLQAITKQEFENLLIEKTENIILDLHKFNSLNLVIKRRLILYTINEVLHTTNGIEKVNIDDIIKLCKNNIGNKYLMPIKEIKVYVKKGKIYFIKT
jgi:tRNA(ile)-lysidine synthase